MTDFILAVIVVMAILSLASYLYCWQDIHTGKPHIISLRQITGIMDRERLNERFGRPEANYRYTLKPEELKKLLRRYGPYFYQECAADMLCLMGAWYYLTDDDASYTAALWFALLASLCQAINFAYSTWLVSKWGHQIREEIDRE